MLVAWPIRRGPITDSTTLDTARIRTNMTATRCGPSRPSRRFIDAPKFPAFAAGAPWARAWGARIGSRCSQRLLNRTLGLDDLDVRRARLEQLLVRADTDGRALLEDDDLVSSAIVDTRWATMITQASSVSGRSAARRRASAEVERRERIVEQVDRRPSHEGAGDRQALSLSAGDGGGALGIGVSSPSGMARTKSAAWAISSAATTRRRWRRVCRNAGCSRRCRRTGTPSAARGRCGSAAARDRAHGHRCPTR